MLLLSETESIALFKRFEMIRKRPAMISNRHLFTDKTLKIFLDLPSNVNDDDIIWLLAENKSRDQKRKIARHCFPFIEEYYDFRGELHPDLKKTIMEEETVYESPTKRQKIEESNDGSLLIECEGLLTDSQEIDMHDYL